MTTQPQSQTKNLNNRYALLSLGGILLIALVLRLWGIRSDLPYVYHPDEPRYILISLNMFKTGDLNPHFFNYPSMFFYIHSASYIPYYWVGKLLGAFDTPANILAPTMLVMGVTHAKVPSIVLLGRIVTIFFGIAAIIMVFLIGKKLLNNSWIGLLAALMMALSLTNIANGQMITPNGLVPFFILLAFLASIPILQQGKNWHYAVAALTIALATASKYNGVLIILSLLSAHFLCYGLAAYKRYPLYLAIILSGFIFFIITPYAILDYPTFIKDIQFEAQHYSTGHAGMEGDSFKWYVSYLWHTEGPLIILALLEIVRGLYTRTKSLIHLSIFPIIYFIFICSFIVRNHPTVLPITPFLYLLASSLIVHLANKLYNIKQTPKLLIGLLGLLVIVCLVWPANKSIEKGLQLTTIDSRKTARIWIEENIHTFPQGTKIAIEAYTPFVDPTHFSVYPVGRIIDQTPDWYIANQIEYLIFSQGMFARFYHYPDQYPAEAELYQQFFNKFTLLKKFTDGGYEIRIYAINKTS